MNNKIFKNLFAGFAILFSLALLFSFFSYATQKPQAISLNELASYVNEGKVKSILVEGSDIKIVLNDGKTFISQKEPEMGIIATLNLLGVSSSSLSQVSINVNNSKSSQIWLNFILPTFLPLIALFLIFWFILRQAKSGANQAFNFGKVNIRLFSSSKNKITFKDVAGLKEAKEELVEVVDFLKNPKKFLEIGARIPRGVLLIGPPGTGKTLLARAVAGESNVPFFHISASEFVEMFVGVGASRVRDLFQTAKRAAPSIIFIDEIDAVGRERGAGLGGGHDEREQTLNQILVEMDGFERDTNVIVIAATNRPDILDPALLRPGRFDRRIVLDIPDINDREEILKIHARDKKLGKDVDLKTVAVRTPGFSGADLANLVNEAAILAARKNKKFITQEDLLSSIEKVILGPERKSRAMSQKEKEITAYHEAGHALVAAMIKEADPVHKISIVSRGLAGGYTLKLPLEDRRLKTKAQFLADLAVSFGGYVAEQIKFGDVSTGSSSDLREATEIAQAMVTVYGMSDLGPRVFGKRESMIFLGKEIAMEKDYSEETGKEIDERINFIINKTFEVAKKIISKHKNVLDRIAKELLQKETLEKEEFYSIIKEYNLKPVSIKI